MKIVINIGALNTMFNSIKARYLLTLLIFSAFTIPSQAEEITIRDLIHTQGCKGCHIIEGTGGTFGPSLDNVGQSLLREQLRRKLIDPKKGNSSSLMPDSRHLTEQELALLTDPRNRFRTHWVFWKCIARPNRP